MAVQIKFDSSHNAIQPTFVLATRSGRKLGAIPAVDIQVSDNFNSYFELEFKVYKNLDGVETALWDKIKDLKLLWCREWDVWFEIYVETSEEDSMLKTISAKSVGEAELSQVNLYNIEINTEDDIARDDYEVTVLYDETNANASLLDRIMEKVPHYKISHVDETIAGIQRTFSFDGVSLYDAFNEIAEEINCIFIIDSGTNSDGEIARSISVYDLEANCNDCGNRDEFSGVCPECGSTNIQTGYGADTSIYVSVENLADNITYTTDVDSVKNCFKLEAGDDLMTSTVINCNPNGSGYIWYISDDTREDMSDELVAKLESYDELYEYYQDEYEAQLDESILEEYNTLIEKYQTYSDDLETLSNPIAGYPALMNAYYNTIDFYLYLSSGLMPSSELDDTTAELEAAKLTAEALSPVAVTSLSSCSASTAASSVLAMAKTIVDSRYQVKVNDSSYSSYIWTGNFTITNYSDEDDTTISDTISVTINDDYESYVRQKLEKALADDEDEVTGITELFALDEDDFEDELGKYCLASLTTFYDSCKACLDILIEQGIADNETWANKDPNMYESLYVPYYTKAEILEDEIALRESEIAVIAGEFDSDGDLVSDGLQTLIESERDAIQSALDFEAYLGEDLWLEFAAYRREDTYQNDNYISDGLDNSELFERALEFIDVAKKDIYKSAILQHSITASLKNLLAMKEFEPIVDYFKVGNWIRIRVDDNLYHLRLISYTIDFENLENISVTFSDVEVAANGVSDSASIMQQAASIATSYGAVSRQASQGSAVKSTLDSWVQDGLSLTNTKIVSNAENQNIIYDSGGLLCREYLPITDTYDEKQLKLINKGIYLTDDNWETARAGFGNFDYYNPETGEEEEGYGVIADTLVSNLILTEKIGIYNTYGTLKLGEDGLIITVDCTDDDSTKAALTIQKKYLDDSDNELTVDVLWTDSDGNLNLIGTVTATSGYIGDGENGWTISDTSIYNGKPSLESTSEGVYIGTDGIALGEDDSVFEVQKDGSFKATNADISGTVTATSGYIGDWTIKEDGLVSPNGYMYLKSAANDDEIDGDDAGSDNPSDGIYFYNKYGDLQGNITFHPYYGWVEMEIDEVTASNNVKAGSVTAGATYAKYYYIYDNDSETYKKLSINTATLADGSTITYLGVSDEDEE